MRKDDARKREERAFEVDNSRPVLTEADLDDLAQAAEAYEALRIRTGIKSGYDGCGASAVVLR